MGDILLLVEDSAEAIELSRHAFNECVFTGVLDVAQDGAEALDYLLRRGRFEGMEGKPPDLILLDIKLPKVNGFDVLKEIRAHEDTRLIPVIIVTASSLQDDLRKGYSLGANSYVRKPMDYDEYVAALRQVCSYWLALNERPPSPVSRAK